MLAKTTKQGKDRKMFFPKNTIDWRDWVLNRDHFDHKHGALTTRPRFRQLTLELWNSVTERRHETLRKLL